MTEPGRQLLVIDDDILVRQSIVAYLEDSGYRVHGEPNGYLGMAWFQEHKPEEKDNSAWQSKGANPLNLADTVQLTPTQDLA